MFKKPSQSLLLLGVLIAIYIVLSMTSKPDPMALERFNITVTQLRLLSLSIVLPLVGIWVAAFYGYIRFKQYALITGDSPDGQPLRHIANGLGVIALSLPLSSVAGAVLNRLAEDSERLVPAATIVTNYVTIILTLVGFWLIAKGAYSLTHTLKKQPSPRYRMWFAGGLVVLACMYLYLTYSNPGRQFPAAPGERATYYLPDWLILTSIIIPYLATWLFGLAAAFHINFYKAFVRGSLYKAALGYLAAGITVVIFSSVSLQFLVANNFSLRSLGLAPLLALIYFLLVVISAGYILVAPGAKRLKKLEEV